MPNFISFHEKHFSEHHSLDRPVLEVDRLSYRYGSRYALEEVTFSLERGQRVAVVGPNGAGKSTLFKIIAGVITPANGRVNVYGDQPGGHICIAYVPQRSQVDWQFPVNVFDVVMMGRIGILGLARLPGSEDKEVVQHCLELVGMESFSQRQINELSGGQQQRMFIARALAQQAELILMDEPLNGLDVPSQDVIFQIFDNLRQRQVTIMVATHDLQQAAQRFDKVMLLNRKLLSFGNPEQALTPEILLKTYGGHLHLISTQDGSMVALGDTCCDDNG